MSSSAGSGDSNIDAGGDGAPERRSQAHDPYKTDKRNAPTALIHSRGDSLSVATSIDHDFDQNLDDANCPEVHLSQKNEAKLESDRAQEGLRKEDGKEKEGQRESDSTHMVLSIILAAIVAFAAVEYAGGREIRAAFDEVVDLASSIPAQGVVINKRSFSVLAGGANATFRNDSQPFNPTNTTPPFFQIFEDEFLDVLGPNATIRMIAQNESFAFAHEAPIWHPATHQIFFASNDGGALGMSDLDHNNQVSVISLNDPAIASGGLVNYTKVPLGDDIQMDNGGTPFRGDLLLITSGRGPSPPSLVRVNPLPPFNDTVILDNFFGRQFNSLNDIKVHPTSGILFFTDVTYGSLFDFRPAPQLPNQVYRFDPDTGSLRVVADGFVRCNGIAFTGDGKTAYVTDTGGSAGFEGNDSTLPATIYTFDVDPKTHSFTNRRVFAYTDNGIPDGIQVDGKGRVYSGCGDGTQVWNANGELIGKFFLGTTSANMAFAGPGRLVIMAETAVFLAEIAANGLPLEDF